MVAFFGRLLIMRIWCYNCFRYFYLIDYGDNVYIDARFLVLGNFRPTIFDSFILAWWYFYNRKCNKFTKNLDHQLDMRWLQSLISLCTRDIIMPYIVSTKNAFIHPTVKILLYLCLHISIKYDMPQVSCIQVWIAYQ